MHADACAAGLFEFTRLEAAFGADEKVDFFCAARLVGIARGVGEDNVSGVRFGEGLLEGDGRADAEQPRAAGLLGGLGGDAGEAVQLRRPRIDDGSGRAQGTPRRGPDLAEGVDELISASCLGCRREDRQAGRKGRQGGGFGDAEEQNGAGAIAGDLFQGGLGDAAAAVEEFQGVSGAEPLDAGGVSGLVGFDFEGLAGLEIGVIDEDPVCRGHRLARLERDAYRTMATSAGVARVDEAMIGQGASAGLEWAALTVDDRETVADTMPEQAQRHGVVQEDLDARVDALLREMEGTSDRVARKIKESEGGAPTLKDLPRPEGEREPNGDVHGEAAAEGGGDVRGRGSGAASELLAATAAELARDGAGPGGESVEALDERLAAAVTDFMDEEEPEGGAEFEAAIGTAVEPVVVEPAVVIEPAEQVEPVGADDGGDEADSVSDKAGGEPARRVVSASAEGRVAGVDVVGVVEALGLGGRAAEQAGEMPGPRTAPAATMAPAAERPGWARRVLDVFVHGVAGAAASARPHAIRLAWRLEQFTVGLSAGTRATIKFVAIWTLLNAIGAWTFVMLQTPEKARAVEEEVPTVISGVE